MPTDLLKYYKGKASYYLTKKFMPTEQLKCYKGKASCYFTMISLEPSLSFLFFFFFWGGGGKIAWYPLFAHAPVFPRNLGIRISLGYFRYMIVILNGRSCTTSIAMLHRGPLLLFFVSPWRNFRRRNNTHCCQGSLVIEISVLQDSPLHDDEAA